MMKAILRAVLVCAATLVVASCSSEAATKAVATVAPPVTPEEIVGAWRTHARFNDGALADLKDLEFMYSFNAGGTLTQSSNYDGSPPVPPGYGVWRQIAPRRFELKYTFYEPAKFEKTHRNAAWVPTGRGIYSETLEMSSDLKSYHSHITYTPVDTQDVPVEGNGDGDAVGARLGF